jgi:hypothetical protein
LYGGLEAPEQRQAHDGGLDGRNADQEQVICCERTDLHQADAGYREQESGHHDGAAGVAADRLRSACHGSDGRADPSIRPVRAKVGRVPPVTEPGAADLPKAAPGE